LSSSHPSITFVLTSCGRFELLRQTLQTFFAHNTHKFDKYVIVEDSLDDGIFKVLDEFDEKFEVIFNTKKLGQMRSIDRAYASVTSDYVFHCEDDWRFFGGGYLEDSLALLQHDPAITVVSCRDLKQGAHISEIMKQPVLEHNGIHYRTDDMARSENWGGYTFNPGLRRMSDYKAIGNFSKLGHEKQISRYFLAKNMYIAYLSEPSWETTGRDQRLPKIDKRASRLVRIKRALTAKWLHSK